jgi:Protein of unknown function (DUF3800)
MLPNRSHPAYPLLGLVCGYASPYRGRKLLLMLRGFADESGDDGQSSFLALAGYVLPFEKWVAFTEDWEIALKKRPAIKYFHMVEAEHGEGEFLGIQEPFRRMKVNDMVEVIEKHEPLGLSTYIRLKDWEALAKPFARIGFENAYYPLFSTIIFLLVGDNLINKSETPVTFIFDEKTAIQHHAVAAYDAVKRGTEVFPHIHRLMGGTPSFEDDKKVLPLQAADLLVWQRRRSLDFPSENRSAWNRLKQTISFECFLDESYLLNLLQEREGALGL